MPSRFSHLEYERLLYTLPQSYPEIKSSSLHFFTTSGSATYPHHYHEPPHIKHNRKPAPGISFQAPNLPTLIADCIALGASQPAGPPAENKEEPQP